MKTETQIHPTKTPSVSSEFIQQLELTPTGNDHIGKTPLRVGLLLDDFEVPVWTYNMIRTIQSSDYADICVVIVNDHPAPETNNTLTQKITRNLGRLSYLGVRKILEEIYDKVIERNTYLPNAEDTKSCRPLLETAETISAKTDRKVWSDYFKQDDVKAIKKHTPDILIRCGFGILRGDILNTARYGIWSLHHGDNRINRGGPAGFWESMGNWPETGSILQILSEDLDNGTVLSRSYSSTNSMSVQDSKSNYYWKTLALIPRKLEELHRLGEEEFFARVAQENRHPEFYSERLYTSPTNGELAKLTWDKLVKKVVMQYENRFVHDQWILLFDLKNEFSSSLWRYKQIIPPNDRFWADPHVIERDDKYYIYLEEYLYSSQKGHISLIEMDSDGNYQPPKTILEKDYHMSYPFVFEDNGVTYMVPETMDNGSIDLYECTGFPDKWEFKMTLVSDIDAVDATLLFRDNKWWMFANVVEREGMSSCDELYIFSSDQLLSDKWKPHPMNPVVSDVKVARPAGKFFTEGDRLYRPSQNCSHRYGYGFNINEVTLLSETEYREKVVSEVKPNWDKKIVATHTFNRAGRLHIIDAIKQRRQS